MKQSNIRYGISLGFRGLIFLTAFILGKQLLTDDFTPFLTWWLTLVAITITFYPLLGIVFQKFHDGGWMFCKTIGLALAGYVMWFLSSIHVLRFTRANTIITLSLCFAINMLLVFFTHRKSLKEDTSHTLYNLYQFDRQRLKSVFTIELMFFVVFLLWTYIRGFRPEVSNTESPMDYGFMAAMMRTDYLPAEDIWMSGKSINYYYVGQYIATYLTKLSGVSINVGYNLALMTIAGSAFTLSYSLIYNVTRFFAIDCTQNRRYTGKELILIKIKRFPSMLCTLSGLVAGIAVVFAGNMHYVIFYWIKPWYEKLKNLEVSSYWWPNSTRYIGYNPEVADDKTIHEFPSYSFILGDLHAHVVNIIFVLSVLGLLFAFLLYRKDKMDNLRLGISIEQPNFKKEALHPIILLLGFFIGLFHMTNFWDFPIYYVVCGAIILFSNAVLYQFTLDAIKLTAVHAAVIIGLAELVALPFTLNFESISAGIDIAYNHTKWYQLLILWGLPVIIIAYYVIARYRDLKAEGYLTNKGSEYFKRKAGRPKRKILTHEERSEARITYGGEKNKLFQFIENLPISDLFIITIGLCGIGLIILPELIYVVDIYPSYARANTMFKLTYQGFIMFGLSMGYILLKTIRYTRKALRRTFAILGLLLLAWTSWYSVTSIDMWQGNIFKTDNYKNLDSIEFMKLRCEDDYNAIRWLNQNVDGTKVITEAYGDSYSNYNRISAFTGLPTIIGWQTHEHLWRSGALDGFPPEVTMRNEDVTSIYSSSDINEILYYLRKYDVDYIYLGSLEQERFGATNNELLKGLGDIVFYSEKTESKDYETAIIEVDKSLYETVDDIDETLNDQS